MKLFLFIPLLFCFLGFGYGEKQEVAFQLNNPIKGRWQTEQIQIQYVVDSHLVHEQEIAVEKGNVYEFDGTKVRVKYADGTTDAGTYSVLTEGEKKRIVLHLAGAATSYLLISVTPTHLVWQKDLDDVVYQEGFTQKSAERAVYTEVFKKVIVNEVE